MAVSVDIEAVKRRLAAERTAILEERRRLLEDSPRPPEAGADNGAGDHSAANPSEALNREVSLSLEDNAEHLLAAIDSALARVAGGTYGMCDRCAGVIGRERLEALPWATKCIECKRLEERG